MVLSMEKWVGKVAIVTGASAGCGASIAENLVKCGLRVVGLARRVEKIELLADKLQAQKSIKGILYGFKADITKEEDIKAAFDWTLKNVGPVSILINNAGVSQNTTLMKGDTEKWRSVLETNVLGLSIATREAIAHMEGQSEYPVGHIIHINSVLGHYVAHVPNVNMYCASKFAVTALTETLRQELLGQKGKIRITSVSPGPVDTEFATANKLSTNATFDEVYKKLPKLRADDVADAVIYVLSTPEHVQVQDVILRPLGEFV